MPMVAGPKGTAGNACASCSRGVALVVARAGGGWQAARDGGTGRLHRGEPDHLRLCAPVRACRTDRRRRLPVGRERRGLMPFAETRAALGNLIG